MFMNYCGDTLNIFHIHFFQKDMYEMNFRALWHMPPQNVINFQNCIFQIPGFFKVLFWTKKRQLRRRKSKKLATRKMWQWWKSVLFLFPREDFYCAFWDCHMSFSREIGKNGANVLLRKSWQMLQNVVETRW